MQVKHPQPIIEVQGLNFSYGAHPILKDISFTIEEGDYVAVLGPNGGGKSTLLKIILGLLDPEQGSVRVFGEGIKKLRHRERISYVPQRAAQEEAQFPATVAEVVASGTVAGSPLIGRTQASSQKAVRIALSTADIGQFADRLVYNLSGGERQRVYIARALAGQPKILVLDEPTAGVDVEAQQHFYRFLKQINKDFGLTILFASHDIDVITHQADTVLCINQRLVSHGSTDDVVHSAAFRQLYGAHPRQH